LRPDEVLDDYIPTTADELDAIGQGWPLSFMTVLFKIM
jgi:hypothetical protein